MATNNNNNNDNLPLSLIIEHILPFINDRITWNNVILTCTEAHEIFAKSVQKNNNETTIKNANNYFSLMPPPWPTPFYHNFEDVHGAKTRQLLSFSCDGNTLALTTPRGNLYLINRWTGINPFATKTNDNSNNNEPIHQALFAPTNPSLIAIGSDNKNVRIWNLCTIINFKSNNTTTTSTTSLSSFYDSTTIIPGSASSSGIIAWSPNGTILANACNDSKIRLYSISNDGKTKSLYRILSHPVGTINQQMQFGPTGRYLAACKFGETLLWDFRKDEPNNDNNNRQMGIMQELEPFLSIKSRGSIASFAFSPCGKYIAVTDWSMKLVRIYDFYDSSCIAEFDKGPRIYHFIQYHPKDSTKIVTTSIDGNIAVWQISTNARYFMDQHGYKYKGVLLFTTSCSNWVMDATLNNENIMVTVNLGLNVRRRFVGLYFHPDPLTMTAEGRREINDNKSSNKEKNNQEPMTDGDDDITNQLLDI